MKWKDIIFIISVIFVFVAFAEAKTTTLIYGTIFQEKDNLSLPAAQITLKNLDSDELKAYTSDLRGKYNISDIKPGKYAITVEVGGFEPVTKEVEVQANQQIELNFKLKIASVRETLVVTATRTERPLKDVTVRTQLIRRSDIENRMAFFLADALNYSSGIRVENNCQNCGFFQIRMNGLEGKYTQILMDGMDAFSSLAQVYGAEHIPSEMIDRIEVVKGGGSSLYGGQAVAGTINIISRKPSYTGMVIDTMLGWQKGEPNYDFGGYGSWLSSEGTLGLQFFAKYLQQNPTDRNDDGFTDTTKRNLSSTGIKLFKQFVSLNAQMTADVHYMHEFRRGGNKLDLTNPTVDPGTYVMIPGGQREFQQWIVPIIPRGAAGVSTGVYGAGACSGGYTGGAVGSGSFIWPAVNRYISGNDYWSGHLAIDIGSALGEPIFAADSGVVVFAGWSTGGYGYAVAIDHGNGYQTLYAHLSKVNVSCGQSVSQGQTIGLGGSTGNSTGAHLHFEIRYQGGFTNPWYVLPAP